MATSAYRDTKAMFGLLSNARLTAITWGTTQEMTPAWIAKYCDELWVPVTPSWFGNAGKAPNGFDLDQLKADVAAISSSPLQLTERKMHVQFRIFWPARRHRN